MFRSNEIDLNILTSKEFVAHILDYMSDKSCLSVSV